MLSETMTINNPSGLHARPASNFVKTANSFKAAVTLKYNGKEYNAKSILALMSAAIKNGSTIEVVCDGEDEQAAMDSLRAAVESGLGE
jgi:Phosphotransferase System HPr (HPr) Family